MQMNDLDLQRFAALQKAKTNPIAADTGRQHP